MRSLKKVFAGLVIGSMLLNVTAVALAQVVVISNPKTKEIGLSKDSIADIYLGKLKVFKDGSRIKPVDQKKESAIRKKFYRSVLKMSENEVNRYWAKRKFSGKGKPPTIINGDQAIKEWVANNSGAIGYIDAENVDSSVKVLLIIP